MSDPLESWVSLNAAVALMDEHQCRELLERELAGKKRKMFVLRLHSRINKARADRERAELREQI